MNGEPREGNLTTANLVASPKTPTGSRDDGHRVLQEVVAENRLKHLGKEETQLAPLFAEDVASEFRLRWDVVQKGFVDDPRRAVRDGDELIAQVMKSMAETFSNERASLEGQLNQADHSSTENLRLTLRGYRSFFERLLSV
jgi:hypothetical protein